MTKKLIIPLLLLLASLCSQSAVAATYYVWKTQTISTSPFTTLSNTEFATGSTMCNQMITLQEAQSASLSTATYQYQSVNPSCNYSGSVTSGAPTSTASGGISLTYTSRKTTNSTGAITDTTQTTSGLYLYGLAKTTSCGTGQKEIAATHALVSGDSQCGADHCQYTVNNSTVKMIMSGSNTYVANATGTGNSCNISDPGLVPPAYSNSAGSGCYVGNDNTVACMAHPSTNCGTVNGDAVCLTSVAAGECATLGSGAVICGSTAAYSAPPAPNNGTSSTTPATPTVTYQSTVGYSSETNYFSTTITNNQASSSASSSTSSGGSGSSSSGSSSSGECSTSDCSDAGQPTFDKTKLKEFGDGTSTWGDADGKYLGKVGEFMDKMKSVFPFSLLASPVIALSSGTPSPPTGQLVVAGRSITWDMSRWDSMFAWIRAGEGLLLVAGFWMIGMATIRGWST